MTSSGERDRPIGRVAGADHERDREEHERDDHQRRVDRRPHPGGAVGVGVVGEADDGGAEHRQDADQQRDVRPDRLADDVEDQRDGQRADRDVGQGRVNRVAQPRPVEEVLHRPHRPEQRRQPAVVEVAERPSPARLGVDEPRHEATDHRGHLPPAAYGRRTPPDRGFAYNSSRCRRNSRPRPNRRRRRGPRSQPSTIATGATTGESSSSSSG